MASQNESVSAETNILSEVAENVLSLGISVFSILFNIISLLTGGSSSVNALGSVILTLVPYLVTYMLNTVLPKLGLLAVAEFTGTILVDAGLFTATDGAGYAITVGGQIVVLVTNAYWWFQGLLSDITDTDNVATQPTWLFGG